MKKLKKLAIIGLAAVTVSGCSPNKNYKSYDDYPVRSGDLLEMIYTPQSTSFMLWSPIAEDVRVFIYKSGEGGSPETSVTLKKDEEGTWKGTLGEDWKGYFYAFNVKIEGAWLGETPGINARAVGVNGNRGAIIDINETNPDGWHNDKRPTLKSPADMIVYEMHHRDFSIHAASGIDNNGKYLALTEENTVIPNTTTATGIDHLTDLGITHVHLLPSFDYASIDERTLSENNYNWGYDPQNYNVPEGSYSIDPHNPASRITEFKKMVQALHAKGIGVILDVVYNHTFTLNNSPFERTVPGYFYRHNPDGTYADGSACGNETASERAMMRKYMIESVLYWIKEYHIDGFRFDLMGIHDIETMNQIRKAVNAIDPSIVIYGEGWSATAPQYPADSLAMKAHIQRMPGIAAFSDEFRDGLRGPFNDDKQGAFLAGNPGNEESIKFGLVGAIEHPQIDYSKVNYTDAPWATQPTQMISYVSCHDDMCLVDRLKSTIPNIRPDELIRLNKLAQTAVFTSQGIPFIYAGEEVMRDKKGVHNSYKSPDDINAIDWNRKIQNNDTYQFYKALIQLRKNHPAFRMGDADLIRKHLEFLPTLQDNIVAFHLKDHANGDLWKDIIVIFNANKMPIKQIVPAGQYTTVCNNGQINEKGNGFQYGKEAYVAPQSALILHN
ncbi:type I pullulanase [Bacteroides sp. 519]|uniref:type I pullulanase n=1 Tax=Bacteroides sp. 519 TaxID=2302937 RepID=UPI0013D5CB73|nr:type I pullulanase [Bacteroides sp. 519]NDV58384.1 type I pullulanase [Bacteroides sp. 519]